MTATIRPAIRPTHKQHLAWQRLQDRQTSFILYGGAAGGGKSWLGSEWLLTSSYFYPGTKYFVGREELKRLRDSFLPTWSKVLKYHRIPLSDWKYNGQDHYLINTVTDSRIDLLDLKYLPSDQFYERYGSLEFTAGWIEEGGEVEEAAFDTLKSRVGRQLNKEYGLLGKILITCNPKKNWLYSYFYKPWKDGELSPEMAFIPALVTDNKFIDTQYIDNLKRLSDPVKRARLLLGDWEYDDDENALIEYDAILDLFTNDHIGTGGGRAITADVALMGSDRFVLAAWDGRKLLELVSMQKSDGREVIDAINNLRRKYQVPNSRIVYDADGVGGFIGGFLPGAKSFQNGSAAVGGENYENLKTQCFYRLASRVNARELDLSRLTDRQVRNDLVQELEQVKRRDADGDGRLKIARKDDVKLAIGRSPDLADAVMMREYLELPTKKLAAIAGGVKKG